MIAEHFNKKVLNILQQIQVCEPINFCPFHEQGKR